MLEYVADKVITSKTKSRAQVKDSYKTPAPQRRSSIPAQFKKQILGANACCQYKSPITQKICTSTWQLEVHHLKPVWAGGSDALENLSVLCGQQNRHVYREEAGIRFS